MRKTRIGAALAAACIQAAAVGAVIEVPGDQPSVQAAIDAASPGDEIVVGAGSWVGALAVTTSGLLIRAADDAAPDLFSPSPTDPVLVVDGAAGVELRGFRLLSPNGVGVRLQGGAGLLLDRCTISGHASGIEALGGTVAAITNSVIVGQSVRGVLADGGAQVDIVNATLVDNQKAVEAFGAASVRASNCIFRALPVVWASAVDASITLTRCNVEAALPPGVVGSGLSFTDPLFADAAQNDFRLTPGSPAIDAGQDALVRGPADRDGNARVEGASVDLGAFEAGAPPAEEPPAPACPGDADNNGVVDVNDLVFVVNRLGDSCD